MQRESEVGRMNPDEIRQRAAGMAALARDAANDVDVLLDVLAVRDQQLAAAEADLDLARQTNGTLHSDLSDAESALAVRDQQIEDAREVIGAAASLLDGDDMPDPSDTEDWFEMRRALLAGLDVQEAGPVPKGR